MRTVFLRALEADDKAAALRSAIRDPEAAQGRQRFDVDPTAFRDIETSPFAYWVSQRLRAIFRSLSPFEGDGRTAKQGLATTDDFRFVRTWWGVPPRSVGITWFPFTKGGVFAPFYADIKLCLDWRRNGAQSWAIYQARRDVVGGIIKNPEYYFRPGLSWPLRGVRFSAQAVPSGCIFSIGGKMAFAPHNDLECFLGILNSLPFDKLLCFFAGKVGGVQYQNGLIQIVPVPHLSSQDKIDLGRLARRGWSVKRSVDSQNQVSHAFTLPALLQVEGDTLAVRANAWSKRLTALDADLVRTQSEIDARCFDLYGIDAADRRAITDGFGGGEDEAGEQGSFDADIGVDAEAEGDGESHDDAGAGALATELVSWAVGVAFGRFDLLLASGARALPAEREPFDPLPVCSPGMLTGDDGLPLATPPPDYPLVFPENGILVDDPGHARDLTIAVRAVFGVVLGADADARWHEAAGLLDPKGHDLRSWLAGSFFEHHLKRHSKSRRKAPILWQLGTPAGRYSVWLYAHRLTRDSFFQLQNEVVGPKLSHEERQLTTLVQNAAGSPSAQERKAIAGQEAFVEELRAMLDEVKRIAPLWNPNLDDGVVLTMAPLWRLVPHKPWQKDLKTKWDELATGEYDWAHLAMHLWPERVVPKCAADRSFAIAHGLEEVFWVEGADGKWRPRSTPTRSLEELVGERSSPAVKAALKSLLDAPVTTAGGRARGTRTRTIHA